MPADQSHDPSQRIKDIKALLDLFRMERTVYLAATSIAVVMMFVNLAMLLVWKKIGPSELTLLFGSTGVVGFCISRLLAMWNDALRIYGLREGVAEPLSGGGTVKEGQNSAEATGASDDK